MGSDYTLDSCLWELTLRCNMRCLHCGSAAGIARYQELTLPQCLRVADEILELGCREVTLIGGEVFLFKGWNELARYLSKRGLLVNLMTNGYLLSDEVVSQIVDAGLTNVGISIDGMEQNHNRIRGKADSFDRIRLALDRLNNHRVPIAAVTSLQKSNVSDLEGLYAFLTRNNIQLWQLQLVNPMGNIARRTDMLVAPRQIPSITRFIKEKNAERRTVVLAADSIGYYDENETYIRGIRNPVSYWEGCQAGISSLFIDSVGRVKGCGALYADAFVEGVLTERPLADIWNDAEAFAYNRRFDVCLLSGRCAKCDVSGVCKGGCRSSNYFNSGTLYENAYCRRKEQSSQK